MRASSVIRRLVAYPPLAALFVILLPALAAAQEPVKSFDQLSTRLKVGDTVWVTDAQGREIQGRISALAPTSVTLGDGEGRTLSADDVRVVRVRQHDSLWNGTLIGLAVGLGVGVAMGASCSEGGDWCGGGATVGYPVAGAVIGTGTGLAVDAVRRGKKLPIYRASGVSGSARLSIAPVITPRTKGVAVRYSF